MTRSPSTQPPLVGRQRPRSKLLDWLARAHGGEGMLALVAGEAGVGKSRLVREVLADAPGDALTSAGVRDEGVPFGPIVQLLRVHLRRAGHHPSALGPLAPHLSPLLPELGPPPQATDRGALFEAVRCAFAEVAAEGVSTLFVDDLHWADEGTLELLQALEEGLTGLPLAVVGAYRSEELAQDHPLRRFRAELRRRGRLREIVLEPLSLTESGELVQWIRGRMAESARPGGAEPRAVGAPYPDPDLVRQLHGARIPSACGRTPPTTPGESSGRAGCGRSFGRGPPAPCT